MNCECPDWKPNTKILNGYVAFAVVHGLGDYKAQEGKVFAFCPWCGDALVDEMVIPPRSLDVGTMTEQM